MGSFGLLEIGLVLLIVLIVMGPKRLPGVGKQLGSSMREFKDAITSRGSDEEPRALPPAEDPAVMATPPVRERSTV